MADIYWNPDWGIPTKLRNYLVREHGPVRTFECVNAMPQEYLRGLDFCLPIICSYHGIGAALWVWNYAGGGISSSWCLKTARGSYMADSVFLMAMRMNGGRLEVLEDIPGLLKDVPYLSWMLSWRAVD